MLTSIGSATHRNSSDEVELIKSIKAGDVEALEELYDLYHRLLFGIILSIVKKREEAEQLLQEIFMKVWNEAEMFKEERDNVFSWIVALTRKRAIEHIRSNEDQTDQSVLQETMNGIETEHYDPMKTTIFSDRSELVKRALDEIPKKQSEIIKIAYSRGLTHSEIAGNLGIPLGTVKTNIREGMFALKRILSEYITTDG